MPIVGGMHYVCYMIMVFIDSNLFKLPGLLHNLSKSDSAKKRLPVREIANLVRPIMNIPDHIISKKDKAITALTVANLLEG